MFLTRVILSLCQFMLGVIIGGYVIYYTYRAFIKANPDFNMEDSIKNGNVAVGILLSTNILAASMILHKSFLSVAAMWRMYASSPSDYTLHAWQMGLITLAHLGFTMMLAMMAISITLRLFGKMVRKRIHLGKELEKGNVAVGILLACVVIIISIYVGEGINTMSQALIPQPSIGQIEIME